MAKKASTPAKPKATEETRRRDYEMNSAKIQRAMLSFYQDHQRRPTDEELGKASGLSRQTVHKHMKQLNGMEIFKDGVKRMQLLTEPMMMAIYNSGMKGSSRSQELFMQLAHNWAKPQQFIITDDPANNEALVPETVEELDETIEMLTKYRNDVKRIQTANSNPEE